MSGTVRLRRCGRARVALRVRSVNAA